MAWKRSGVRTSPGPPKRLNPHLESPRLTKCSDVHVVNRELIEYKVQNRMPFEPDILVTAPDYPSIRVVVEAKTRLTNPERSENELKEYMVRMQCPVGVLITPDHLWLYRDSYTTRAPESIRRVGDYDVSKAWLQPPPTDGIRFEAFVQDWLENLPNASTSSFPKDLREALREHIIPAITAGDVRAAHPRYS